MNKDQIKGRMKTSIGAVKEVAGKILGDSQQESEGNLKKIWARLSQPTVILKKK